jgi:cytochrome c-type biogenesis protein
MLAAIALALWLGILTSISPCPLATNIAAISYISKKLSSSRFVFVSGLLYILGRVIAYVAIAIVIVESLSADYVVSHFFDKYMNRLLGPILIVSGMFLLELLKINFQVPGADEKLQKKADTWGIWGAFLLGMIFAVAFCPLSATLFFVNLISLCLKFHSAVVLPLIYGIGTGLPVLLFAILIAYSSQSIGKAYKNLQIIEWWARRVTGVIFILVGIYYCLVYIFGVL